MMQNTNSCTRRTTYEKHARALWFDSFTGQQTCLCGFGVLGWQNLQASILRSDSQPFENGEVPCHPRGIWEQVGVFFVCRLSGWEGVMLLASRRQDEGNTQRQSSLMQNRLTQLLAEEEPPGTSGILDFVSHG